MKKHLTRLEIISLFSISIKVLLSINIYVNIDHVVYKLFKIF
jgi:hypothetical protein